MLASVHIGKTGDFSLFFSKKKAVTGGGGLQPSLAVKFWGYRWGVL